jgi:hypothetical protein
VEEEVVVDLRAVPTWLRWLVARALLSRLFVLSPVLTCVLAGSVITCCHVVARASGHLAPWLRFPAISFTYFLAPEYYVGSGGFLVVMVLFFVMMGPFISVAFAAVERELVGRVFLTGFLAAVAFIFLFLQAAIPMQANTMDIIDRQQAANATDSAADSASASSVPRLRPQTILHQLCAVGFFLSALAHGVTVLWLLRDSQHVPVARKHLPGNWWLKACMLVAVTFPALVSFLVHPGSGHLDAKRFTVELAGVTQWGAVFFIIAFFGLYSADFHAIREFALHNADALVAARVVPPDLLPLPQPLHPAARLPRLVVRGADDGDSATLYQLLRRVLTLDGQVAFRAGKLHFA